jgi:hypothetical protein
MYSLLTCTLIIAAEAYPGKETNLFLLLKMLCTGAMKDTGNGQQNPMQEKKQVF